MRDIIGKVFFDHPDGVGESYGEHFVFAAGFGGALIAAGCAAIIHALIPCLFERTASTTVKRLHAIIANRGAAPAKVAAPEPLAYI